MNFYCDYFPLGGLTIFIIMFFALSSVIEVIDLA